MRSLLILALLIAPALTVRVFAQDSLMTAAQAQFKPIPTTRARARRQPRDASQSRDSGRCCISIRGFRPATRSAAIPATTSGWAASMPGDVDRASLAARRPQFADGLQCRIQHRAVLGRPRQGPGGAGGWPLVNPIEMASPPEHVVEQLAAIPGYVAAFKAAFPGDVTPRHARERAEGDRRL